MAEFFDALDDKHVELIGKQPVFFVATAAPDGRVNLSPKGYDAFRVLSPNRVAYLDLAGSGNETQAHLSRNSRITVMFCNFEQPAMILRLYGQGRAVAPDDADWDELAANFTLLPGTRQIFDIAVETVQTSCGYGVPFMQFERERDTLVRYHENADREAWLTKRANQTHSIDGIPIRPLDRYIASE